jgi:tetratricopeptide (TPR) repeat protein
MSTTAAYFVVIAMAFTPSAFAQSAPPGAVLSNPDLPLSSDVRLERVVPGVGATPGIVLQVESPSSTCSRDARKAADGLMTPHDAVIKCNEAITSGVVPERELAGTHVNRGVLLMSMRQLADARRDFEQALQIAPSQAEALVNLAIIDHTEGRLFEALEKLERGLALGPENPERAYLHRGRVREDLKDASGAYADYKLAATLRPGWEPVVSELARFEVRPGSSGK